MSGRLEFAKQIATQVGARLRRAFGRRQRVAHKGRIDLVTEMDLSVERTLIRQIRRRFPRDAVLAEESGTWPERGSGLWLIDPLDGTTNYAHGFPFYAVSIAYACSGQVELGVVYAPQLDHLFWARRGKGAFRGRERLRVSESSVLDAALVATGFPYDVREHRLNNLAYFRRAQLGTRGVRRAGAASLDFAYLAAGVFDGYWELRLKPWDMAAGALLVTEAGGKVTDLNGRPFHLRSASVLASNGKIHDHLRQLLRGRG